ncbi:tannase and feruloyl esterase [Dendrothele bispora CBS 962.96]|uniref:Carboxylic ester hydrolase n=1 Tax=Dendrothele bispora (strain CBS 962.96) TaxID=1314807 RepID=A0A4S8LTZ0_DENBC|nr:tannase and feruloyl esterase [Dendrothele bispora CBS 962.96]
MAPLPSLWTVLPAILLGVTSLARSFDFDTTCSSITSQVSIPNATVYFSSLVPGGTNLTFPDNDPTCTRPSQLVLTDMCRIAMFGINFEAWFPRNWTGRFLSTGNGGLSGCIQYEDLAYAAALGFATVGANNGHNGTSGAPFLNNPDVVETSPFVRAMHTGVVTFYGSPYTKSYYLGCSTGGRQGLKSVQDFPEDFDGVVAGAPAVDFDHLNDWSAQCDEIDGVKDGVIEDPNLCDYDPSTLVCVEGSTNQTNTTCITEAQAGMIKNVFKPFFIEGQFAYPRMQPAPSTYTSDWFRYVVYNDPNYDVTTLSEKDWAYSAQLDPFNISTWSGDLSTFRERQGKVLSYHGQADAIISSKNSERYYDRVSQVMGLQSTELDEFYRLFRISGMHHCSGGPGAWGDCNYLVDLDPESNVLMAMVRWVEEGIAPETCWGRNL